MDQEFEQRSPSPLSQKPDVSSPPEWRDLWAAVLFYIQLLAAVALGSYAVYKVWGPISNSTAGLDMGNGISIVLWELGGCLALSMVLLVVALYLFRYHAVVAIHGSFLGQISLYVIILLYLVFEASFSGGKEQILLLLLGPALLLIITTVFYLILRSRIPLSAAILGLVNDTISTYPKLLFLPLYNAVTLVFVLVFYVVSGLTIIYLGDCVEVCTAFMVASGLWTAEVVGNVFYTTAAGVFATAYFTGSGQKVERATSSSFRRAITYSFGSICLGSLIVASIQFARLLIRAICKRGSLARLMFEHLLRIVEDLAAYFNSFAYIEIAIYGKPFRQSGKDVWSLIKRRGMDAVINDNMIGTACFFASLTAGLINWIVIALVSQFVMAVPTSQAFAYAIPYFFLTVSIFHAVLGVLVTGSRTIFVCLAEDPAALQRNGPEAYGLIAREYGDLML